MKLSNHILGFCIQIILTTVLSSPVGIQNVTTYKRKCGFVNKVLNTNSENRFKRFAMFGTPWKLKNVTWNFLNQVHPKSQNDLHLIKSSLRDSFRRWEEQINDLKFHETNATIADIMITFERLDHGDECEKFDDRGKVYAHASAPGLDSMIHFDEDENWNFKGVNFNKGIVDFYPVALHEIGHTLGLDHSHIKEAIMYAYDTKHIHELHEDDIQGIQSLYGVPQTTTIQTTQQSVKPTDNYQTPQTPDPRDLIPTKPNRCDIQFDAISVIQNQIYIFKAQYMWKFTEGSSASAEPIEIHRFYKGFPKSVTKIDAFYENKQRRQFWMFVNKEIYVYGKLRNRTFSLLFIWNLSQLQLPHYVGKIDAIFTWGNDGRTFIFAGNKYWRMDEMAINVENRKPQLINSMWKNVDNIDTGFQLNNKTYLFKGNSFYEFDEVNQTIHLDQPKSALEYWMNCPPTPEDEVTSENPKDEDSSAITVQCSILFILLVSMLSQMF